jgi:hypothetical protein
LPNSGVTIRVSTLYWQYGGPRDERLALNPHIPITLSSRDYGEGRDPVMDKVLALSSGPSPASAAQGDWSSQVLGYSSVFTISHSSSGWSGDIDFVDMDANDLPLQQVSYEAPLLSFDFQAANQVISFQGELYGNVILGKAVARGQSYPWVALRR